MNFLIYPIHLSNGTCPATKFPFSCPFHLPFHLQRKSYTPQKRSGSPLGPNILPMPPLTTPEFWSILSPGLYMVQDNIGDISEIKNHNTMHCSLTGAWRPVRLRYPVAGGVNPQVSSQSSEPHHRQHEPYHWCNICGNRFGCNTVFGLAQKADCVANQEKLDQYGQKIAQ